MWNRAKSDKITFYKDANDRFFVVGDLVYNPTIGDVWEVMEYKNPSSDGCKYALVLWGDWNNYYMDLDEPVGFTILASRGEKGYHKLKWKCRRITRKIRKENEK